MDCDRNRNLAAFYLLAICVWGHSTTVQGQTTLSTNYADEACPQEEVVFTCSISGSILRWSVIPTSELVTRETFFGDQPDRLINAAGTMFTASVTSPPPNFMSILSTTATTSLEGVGVECADGDSGLTSEITILIASSPSSPSNLRITNSQNGTVSSTVTLQWDPPSSNGGNDVDNYTLTVTPGGSSSVTVTMATVELSYNTEYTVRVSATNCAGRSPEATLGPFTLSRANCSSPSAANGVVIDHEPFTSTTVGSVIHYQCGETFVPNTRVEAVCRNNGSWSPDPGQHVCTLVDCRAPQLPSNSTLITSTGTLKGQEVTFQCSIGPDPLPITSVCTSVSDSSSEGVWSPDPQQVVCEVACSTPDRPRNGFISGVTSSSLIFGCNEGYTPQGTMTAVCVSADTWNPDPAQLVCSATNEGTCADQVVSVAAVTSAVVCSAVVFYILGIVSTILVNLAITRCRKKNDHETSVSAKNKATTGPVYEDIIPVQDSETTGIELQENVAYGPVKK